FEGAPLLRTAASRLKYLRDGYWRLSGLFRQLFAIRSARLIRQSQGRRLSPQPLQVIESPRLLSKHVHDKSAEIEQRPLRRAVPLAMFRGAFHLAVEHFLDLRANSLQLRRAVTSANHKIFGECAQPT